MKRILLLAVAIGIAAVFASDLYAMSNSKVRKNARFLTDRMAYELNLSDQQYNDVYEINFDFIDNIRYIMDDVVTGNTWALEDYYRMLDLRNDDLSWVLSNNQYMRFMGLEYFNRPIFASGGGWNFRVYVVYPNINFYYFGKPYHYRTYSGGHYRTYYDTRSYYRDRYPHDRYNTSPGFRDYNRYSRDDFKVTPRPGTSTRPSTGNSSSRPSRDDIYDSGRPGSSGSSRPSGSGTTTRPSGTPSTGSGSSARPSGSSSSRPSGNTTTRPSGTSTSRPVNSTTTRPSGTTSSGSNSSARPSGSSSSRPSGESNTRPSNSSSGSSTSRPSSTSVDRSSSSSRSSENKSSVSSRPSSSSSSGSESRSSSGSSGSGRGGRR